MVDKITHFPTGAASSIIALHIKDAVMLEIKHSCETLQQRQRWCVCILLPQATSMAWGNTSRQELLEREIRFSKILNNPQQPRVPWRATIQAKSLIPPERSLLIIFTAQLKLG